MEAGEVGKEVGVGSLLCDMGAIVSMPHNPKLEGKFNRASKQN